MREPSGAGGVGLAREREIGASLGDRDVEKTRLRPAQREREP